MTDNTRAAVRDALVAIDWDGRDPAVIGNVLTAVALEAIDGEVTTPDLIAALEETLRTVAYLQLTGDA